MTANSDPLDLAITELLEVLWQETTVTRSIAKVIIALHQGRLYADTIRNFHIEVRRNGGVSNVSRFLSKVQQIQEIIDIDRNPETILQKILEKARSQQPDLIYGISKLSEQILIEHLSASEAEMLLLGVLPR